MSRKMGKKPSWPKTLLQKFLDLDMAGHIVIATLVRLFLILYGMYHDQNSEVPYTDIDYKVFTDAARHVLNGDSPYKRHTFRYSPLIAFLLVPNVLFHPVFGKIIFSQVDLIVAFLIRRLVYLNVFQYENNLKSTSLKLLSSEQSNVNRNKRHGNKSSQNNIEKAVFWGHRAMICWLYNPMTIAISTRGNSDSIACLLVIYTLYCIQSNKHPFVVGLIHGLSIHFRIYPIIFSLTFYIYYSTYSQNLESNKKLPLLSTKSVKNGHRNKKAKSTTKGDLCGPICQVKEKQPKILFSKKYWTYLLPNVNQIMLIVGCLVSLLSLTGIFYYSYGYHYIYESIIYHFVRIDYRHNFSMYFYLQYLTAFVKMNVWYTANIWQPLLMNLPPIVLLINFSVRYGLNRYSLNFAVLLQTMVFVIYNKVITSQYFVWIMGVLPLCIWQIKMTKTSVLVLLSLWFLAQGAWLLPAYLLEFQGQNTFLYIWVQGVSLFCAHIGILHHLIKHFSGLKSDLKPINHKM